MSSILVPCRHYTCDDVSGVIERVSSHILCPVRYGRASLPDEAFLHLIFARAIATRSGNEFIRAGNKSDGTTRLVEPEKALERLNVSEETYISYSLHRKGQKDENVTRILAVSIDLDAKKQMLGLATDEQIEKICDQVPGAVVIVSHGVQVVLRPPSQNWAECCSHLVALGEHLAAETGLHYDRGCHVTKANRPAAHRGHAYRGPGVAKMVGDVLLLHPATDSIQTTGEVLARLGRQPAKLLPALPRERKGGATYPSVIGNGTPSSRQVGARRGGSFGPKYDEFAEACRQVYALLRSGVPLAEAISQIAARSWTHLKAGELEKSLTAYVADWTIPVPGKGGKYLSNIRDQEVFAGYLVDEPTKKQRMMQKTYAVFAHRAWAMDLFYKMDFSEEESVTAFLRWPLLKRVRRATIRALGGNLAARQYLRDDLSRIYSKYAGGGGARPADPALVGKVLKYCQGLGRPFKASTIPRHIVGVTSERHLRRILGMLVGTGALVKLGSTKNRIYSTPPATHLLNTLCMAESPSADTTSILPMKNPPPATQKAMKLACADQLQMVDPEDGPPVIGDEDDFPPEVPDDVPDQERLNPVVTTKKRKNRFKENRTDSAKWDYCSTFDQDWAAALDCQGDGIKFTGVCSHKFKDEVAFSALYREVYKAVSTRTKDGKRICCGPSLGRIYRFLAKAYPAFTPIGPELQRLEFEHTFSAQDYMERLRDFPRLLSDGVQKIERAGYVTLTDFGSKAVRGNTGSIVRVLNEQQGQDLLISLQYHPWCRATRKTLMMLWEFGFQRLREWMSAKLGEEVPALWLGWRIGRDGKPLVLQAGEDVLRHITAGTIWDE